MNNPIRYVPGAIGALLQCCCLLSGTSKKIVKPLSMFIVLLMACAGSPAFAQLCEQQRQALNSQRAAARQPPDSTTPFMRADLERIVRNMLPDSVFHPAMGPGKGNVMVRSVYPDAPNNIAGLKDWASSMELFIAARRSANYPTEDEQLKLCFLRARMAALDSGGAPSARPNQDSKPNTPSSGKSSDSSASQQAETELASKRQADVDKARQDELKRKNEKAQADAAFALTRAKGAQDIADEKSRGKSKKHSPEGEAHNCLQLKKVGLYGGFNNSCSVRVTYFFCHYQPRKDSWGESLDCEKGKIGMGSVQPNTGAAEHTYNSAMIYWFACKKDFDPADAEFVLGQGLRGRCIP